MMYKLNYQNSNSDGNISANHIGPAFYREPVAHDGITLPSSLDSEGLEHGFRNTLQGTQ